MGENDSFRRGTPCYDGTRFTRLNDDFTSLLLQCALHSVESPVALGKQAAAQKQGLT